jgi:hypothetical protein
MESEYGKPSRYIKGSAVALESDPGYLADDPASPMTVPSPLGSAGSSD